MAEWDDFTKNWKTLQETYSELRQQQNATRQLESKCQSASSKHKKMMDDMVAKLRQQEQTDEVRNKLETLQKMKTQWSDMRENLPKNQPLMLRMMVGTINVTLSDVKERQMYKDRYEHFKRNVTIVIMALSLISIIIPNRRLPTALLNLLTTWYYFALILRENILQVNGSRIQTWWTAHHYFSALIAIVCLLWPRGDCYNAFALQFLLFDFYLSIVMLLQYVYQKGLLYRLKALGRAHPMQVTEEGLRRRALSDLYFIIPFLMLVYVFQVANSIRLFYLYYSSDTFCPYWQVPTLAVLFLIVAIGNTVSLIRVVNRKSLAKPHSS